MGGGSSLPVPLETLTKEDVADAVSGLGANFEPYAQAVTDNAIDGELLGSFDDQDLAETFEELGISSKLHRKVLKKVLENAKKSGTTPAAENRTASKLSDVGESLELETYAQLSERLLDNVGSDTIYAGVNLLSEDTQFCLSSTFRLKNGKVESFLGNEIPIGDSLCKYLISSPQDSLVFPVPDEYPLRAPNGDEFSGPHRYVGHILKAEGEKVGSVCVVESTSEHQTETTNDNGEQERTRLLEDAAAMAESLLKESKALQYRNDKLRSQIEKKKADARPEIERNYSANDLPVVQEGLERAHLPPNFFKDLDKIGHPHPPIRKDDMDRVAAVEALGLMDIDPGDPVAKSLNNIVKMAARMFNYQLASISIHNHEKEFAICRYVAPGTEKRNLEVWASVYEPLKLYCGFPFLESKDRNTSICNYAIHAKKTVVVNDTVNDKVFSPYKIFFRAYVGSPIFNMDGHVVAMLCMFNFKEAKDFNESHKAQIEQITLNISQVIENWALRREMKQLEQERRSLENRGVHHGRTAPPQGEAAIVLTDVQGSTSLWEADASAMQDALNIHDGIMRKCYKEHCGYEITTEGDAFHLAFHDPVDAIHFALKAQVLLHEANWSDAILKLPDAADDGNSFRGLRVRMGIHCGPVSSEENEVSGRMEYKGATWHVTESVESMCHGGQIMATGDAWRVASWVSESLGSPQVVDLGEYVLSTGKTMHEGIISMRVVQLVPNQLAFDYFSARRQHGNKADGPLPKDSDQRAAISAATLQGRSFGPPASKRQLRASFYDAPHANGKVTVAFIYTSEVKDRIESSDSVLAALSKFFSSLLVDFDGYECKTGMFVFASPTNAVKFGLKVMQMLVSKTLDGQSNLGRLLKVGVHSGIFTSMGPNPTTGRADYYGQVVNRAARVAGAAGMGEVYIGVAADDGTPDPPLLCSSIETKLEGVKLLKGVTKEMALFSCSQL